MTDDDLRRDLAALRDPTDTTDLVARTLADAALTDARHRRPVASDLLMARIMRDARSTARARKRADGLVWTGLLAASVAGLLIGFNDPVGLIDLRFDTNAPDYLGAYDFQIAEVN